MKILKTKLDGVLRIQIDIFEDFRGQYLESYNRHNYLEHGIDVEFVQDDFSISDKNVLRGIHGDDLTWKLVSCVYGKFYLMIVNCDENSDDFGKWEGFILSDRLFEQILIPPKYGNGHVVLSDKTVFHYKQSTYYGQAKQFTYKWNHSDFNMWWPVKDPILSVRDEM